MYLLMMELSFFSPSDLRQLALALALALECGEMCMDFCSGIISLPGLDYEEVDVWNDVLIGELKKKKGGGGLNRTL